MRTNRTCIESLERRNLLSATGLLPAVQLPAGQPQLLLPAVDRAIVVTIRVTQAPANGELLPAVRQIVQELNQLLLPAV